MASKPGVYIEGERELRRTLRKAGDDLENIKAAHAQAAAIVTAEAARRAPVRDGTLRDTVRGSGTKTMATVRAGFARVPYAAAIHWGWPSRGIKGQPFVSEAATAMESVWLPVYDQAVQYAISQIRGK
ncbi:HK97 gp10 family phage protein [Nesterenkonia halotolerans]|uniref:HK97 gp10 family phage protein n=1 Tax=Nesterenkonia halotolerans TaxID=225325 RepID=UPI003EE4C84D